ncbi:MAG: aldehyde dehydrogenase [Rhodospirillales bacterium]|nr:aldehyde dehydrogenase [Rhodospirillales bacterium]
MVKAARTGADGTLGRRNAVRALLKDRGDLLVVSGLGSPTWDVAAAGDSASNFYMWGAMGSAATIGLGLALAQPRRPVLVITGDGELMMGMGALATIGVQKPSNFALVVLDNERYGETGMQMSHTAHGIDLAVIARGSGFRTALTIGTMAGVTSLARVLHRKVGPVFAAIKVLAGEDARVLPPRDGVFLKNRFREAILRKADSR